MSSRSAARADPGRGGWSRAGPSASPGTVSGGSGGAGGSDGLPPTGGSSGAWATAIPCKEAMTKSAAVHRIANLLVQCASPGRWPGVFRMLGGASAAGAARVEPPENHASGRRLQHAGDDDTHFLADAAAAALDHHHGAV